MVDDAARLRVDATPETERLGEDECRALGLPFGIALRGDHHGRLRTT